MTKNNTYQALSPVRSAGTDNSSASRPPREGESLATPENCAPATPLSHGRRWAWVFCSLLTLLSCGQVNEDDRLIEIQGATVQRAVLVEDYTGQMCVNCPRATEEIHHLQAEFGSENVIAVGIFSGPFGVNPRTGANLPLTTDTGKEYFTHWGLAEQPVGIVNRHGASSYFDWAAIIHKELQRPTPVSIDIDAFRHEGDSLEMQVRVRCSEALSAHLQLWLTEDSIVGTQYFPDNVIDREYVHNHVFRTAVNGAWGTPLSLQAGQTYSHRFTCLAEDAWRPWHLALVAFVYTADDVLQVTRKPLKTK